MTCKLHTSNEECMLAEDAHISKKCEYCGGQHFFVADKVHYVDIVCIGCRATYRILKELK
jgi:hypothetical protein